MQQAGLQEERKLTETPPATEKKTEATAPVREPVTPPVREPVNASSDGGGRVGTVPAVVENTPASPPKDAEVKLIIPEGVPEIPPVPVIDDLIRRGYRDRDDLEAFMKAKFNGKAYRDDVRERLQLFRARQPPFDDIEVKAPVQPPPTNASTSASTPLVREPPTSASTAPNPQNSPVLPASGTVPNVVPGTVPAASGQRVGAVPAASEQPTKLSEEQLMACHNRI